MIKSFILNTIGDQIRLQRTKKKLSQENMAAEIGISVTAYSRIERGQTNMSIGRLEQIGACLGVSLKHLIVPFEDDHRVVNGVVVRETDYSYRTDFNQRELFSCLEERVIRILEEKIDGILEEKLSHILDGILKERLTHLDSIKETEGTSKDEEGISRS
jgi:transcriptional regulator with XRE-family HTH domain